MEIEEIRRIEAAVGYPFPPTKSSSYSHPRAVERLHIPLAELLRRILRRHVNQSVLSDSPRSLACLRHFFDIYGR